MSPDYRREGTTEEQLERAGKVASVASNAGNVGRLVVGALITSLGIVAATAVWASQRPSMAYVDSAVRTVASSDLAVHHDQDARLSALQETLSEIRAAQRAEVEQNRIAHDRLADQLKEVRGYIVSGRQR